MMANNVTPHRHAIINSYNELLMIPPNGCVTTAPALLIILASPFFIFIALGNNSVSRVSIHVKITIRLSGILLLHTVHIVFD